MNTVPVDELGEEREVDLRSLRDRIMSRWWLVLAGLVLGIVVGVLVATGGGTVYDAKALLYMGQPFVSGSQVNTLATNPRTVSTLVRDEATILKVSNETGVPVGKLRGNVVAQAVTAVGTSAGLGRSAPLMEVTVQLKNKKQAEAAADAFAKAIVAAVGGYVDIKIGILAKRIATDEQRIKVAQQRIDDALRQQQRAATATGLSLADRFLIQANSNNTLQFYEARIGGRSADINEATLLQAQAESIEKSRLVQPSVAAPTTARSRRNSGVVGGLIGLVVGAIASAFWPDRRRSVTSKT
jgi:uncharacterized membrane protein